MSKEPEKVVNMRLYLGRCVKYVLEAGGAKSGI